MSNIFCNNIRHKKRFIKCISEKDKKCYLFVGKNPYIRGIINKIKKNYGNNEDYFKDVHEGMIEKLYDYLYGPETDDIDEKIQFIIDEMNLESEKLEFINEQMNEDDTNEMILNKMVRYCYSNEDVLPEHMYVCFYDNNLKKVIPLGYYYSDSSITYEQFYDKKANKVKKNSFINENGDKIPKLIDNQMLNLFDNYNIKDNTLSFFTIKEYLEKEKIFEKIQGVDEEQINQSIEMKTMINGVLFKYWPKLTLDEILNYDLKDNQIKRKEKRGKIKDLLDNYSLGVNKIESTFFKDKTEEEIQCSNFTLTLMKISRNVKEGEENIIHLSKLFSEYTLSEKVPFMKLLLDSHDDSFYKLYKRSIAYTGYVKTETEFIDKSTCKGWSESYNIQEDNTYKYLHKDNVILFKIYNKELGIYSTLVLHLNGDIECIVENNYKIMNEEIIKELIKDCNKFIDTLNEGEFYSFNKIIKLEDDVFENRYSETKLDFLNCAVSFENQLFQKKKKYFPNWFDWFTTFMENLPMYFRVKSIEETEEKKNKIIGRYKRVNNYASLSAIQSAIETYKVIYDDPEVIIQKVSVDFGKDIDEIRKEYISWEELMRMKMDEGHMLKKRINETGSEIIISISPKDELILEILNLKSFNEFTRIMVYMKTMLYMYQLTLNGDERFKIFFTKKNKKTIEFFDEIDEEENEGFSDEERPIIDDDSSDSQSDDDDLKELKKMMDGSDDSDDSDSDDSDLDIDQFGGEQKYEVKSYYLKRLKEYDQGLFKFKTRKKQKNGVAYGYAKLCGAADHRQPIAVTTDELERINQSEEDGSGRKSYSKAITVPKRDQNIKYICPKYWDVSRSLSIRHDAVDKSEIIPDKLPKNANGKTEKTILNREHRYWVDAKDESYFVPKITEDSKLLHPQGYGLPCCFNESKVKKKEKNIDAADVAGQIQTGYISNKDPVNEDKYAHIHPQLMEYFGQDNKIFTKKKDAGFLKIGVQQNENDYTFTISPFLQSFFKILINNEKNIPENDFIEILIGELEKNLNKFQKCSIIHQTFRKGIRDVTMDDLKYVRKIIDNPNTIKYFTKKVIDNLINEVEDDFNFQSNETSYLFNLLLSLHLYVQYLRSNENRNDTYIIPVVIRLFDINILILENIDDSIKIKKSEYYKSAKKLGMMYKRNNYYEPLLYRYYDEDEEDIKEIFQYSDDNMVDENLKMIIDHMRGIVKDVNINNFIHYSEIIQEKEDEITELYINNYSQVSYIITKKEYIIPIEPVIIPDGKYKYIYSFKKLPKYEDVIEYIKPFNEYCKISEMNKNDDGYINTILFENGTYLPIEPIHEKKVDGKYSLKFGHDLYKIEKCLYNSKNKDDMKEKYIKYMKYEEYITKLSFYHIVKVLMSENEKVIGFAKDHTYYTVGEVGYFTYVKEGDVEYIYKINENEHITYGNYSIYGKVINIVKSGENKGEITFELPLIKKIEFILSDKIMIREDKKRKIYDLIDQYISEIFISMDDSEYSKYETNRFISLCTGKIKDKCRYPCNYYGGCKLYVKEKDIYGNLLIEKIKWKFIEKLLITGVKDNKIMKIIEDRINMSDIRKTIKNDEIFYTFSEYRENILDDIFEKKSDFIVNFGNNKEIKRKYYLLKKMNSVPFYINNLFGYDSTVLFHLNGKNNDYLSLEKALNEVKVWYNVKKLKEILLKRCTKELLEEHIKYGDEYKTIRQLKIGIRGNKYSFTFLDFKNILEEIKEDETLEDNKLGIFILTQKYTPGKNIEKLIVNSKINETLKIISFHHSYYEKDFILSNILVEGEYYSTIKELNLINDQWGKLK